MICNMVDDNIDQTSSHHNKPQQSTNSVRSFSV